MCCCLWLWRLTCLWAQVGVSGNPVKAPSNWLLSKLKPALASALADLAKKPKSRLKARMARMAKPAATSPSSAGSSGTYSCLPSSLLLVYRLSGLPVFTARTGAGAATGAQRDEALRVSTLLGKGLVNRKLMASKKVRNCGVGSLLRQFS